MLLKSIVIPSTPAAKDVPAPRETTPAVPAKPVGPTKFNPVAFSIGVITPSTSPKKSSKTDPSG